MPARTMTTRRYSLRGRLRRNSVDSRTCACFWNVLRAPGVCGDRSHPLVAPDATAAGAGALALALALVLALRAAGAGAWGSAAEAAVNTGGSDSRSGTYPCASRAMDAEDAERLSIAYLCTNRRVGHGVGHCVAKARLDDGSGP